MPGSVINISSSFQISLPDYPVSYRAANPRLFGEVLSNGMLLIYGGYELVFCCSRRENQELLYYTVIVPRTLMKKFLPEKTGLTGKERVQIATGFPLSIQVRAGKASRVSMWERLASIIRDRTWVEVDVEGEISVQTESRYFQNGIEGQQAIAKDVSEESNVHKRAPAYYQEGKNDIPDKQLPDLHSRDGIALTIDSLADLVIQVIQQREKNINKSDDKEKHGDQCLTAKDEMDVLSEILFRYAAQGKKEKGQQERVTVKRNTFAEYDLSSIPLEKIPSRPGLQQTFVQSVPPPKPPNHGG